MQTSYSYTVIMYNFSVTFLGDGGWSEWTEWSKCSKTCGEGEKQRTRQCNNPTPNDLGKQCEGNANDAMTCNQEPCFGMGIAFLFSSYFY